MEDEELRVDVEDTHESDGKWQLVRGLIHNYLDDTY